MMPLFKLIVILTVFVSPAMAASPFRCEIDEYYQTVLEQCHPCSAVCDSLTSDDCVNKCGDYIKSLQECPIDHFWDRNRKICLPCTSICSPLNGTICIKECSRFVKELRKTTELPDSTTPGNTLTRNPIVPVVFTAVVSTIVLLFIGLLLYCFRQKIVQCFNNCLVPDKQEKRPTQETQSPGIEQQTLV